MIAAIAAVAANGMLGREQWLPWDIPEELAYFERTVAGAALVMGRFNLCVNGRGARGFLCVVPCCRPAATSRLSSHAGY